MGRDPRMSRQTLAVLAALLRDPAGRHYGLELTREAKLRTGSLYPILARLEDAGWVDGTWEDVDPSVEGRPRRRYYRLTGLGVSKAKAALQEAMEQLGATSLLPGAQGLTC